MHTATHHLIDRIAANHHHDLIRSAAQLKPAANRQPVSDRRRIVTARRRAVLAGAAARPTAQTVLWPCPG